MPPASAPTHRAWLLLPSVQALTAVHSRTTSATCLVHWCPLRALDGFNLLLPSLLTSVLAPLSRPWLRHPERLRVQHGRVPGVPLRRWMVSTCSLLPPLLLCPGPGCGTLKELRVQHAWFAGVPLWALDGFHLLCALRQAHRRAASAGRGPSTPTAPAWSPADSSLNRPAPFAAPLRCPGTPLNDTEFSYHLFGLKQQVNLIIF